MVLHLTDPDSPSKTIMLSNPGYIEYIESDRLWTPDTIEDLRLLFGDIFSPTYPYQVDSLAYCGTKLVHRPRPHPEYLWECVNYTLPCRIGEEDICEECIRKHGAAREVSRLSRVPRSLPAGAPQSGRAVQAQP